MKVYLVVRCYTEPEYMLYEAFSSREKAGAYVEKLAAKHERFPPWEVLEFDVDPKGEGEG